MPLPRRRAGARAVEEYSSRVAEALHFINRGGVGIGAEDAAAAAAAGTGAGALFDGLHGIDAVVFGDRPAGNESGVSADERGAVRQWREALFNLSGSDCSNHPRLEFPLWDLTNDALAMLD